MKIYLCKVCQDATKVNKVVKLPCSLTVDGDEDYPLYCPYSKDGEAKFKQIYPKVKK